MQVAMKHAPAELTKTPTDGKGTFDFVVHAFEIDKDNERIKSFTGLPTELFIGYQHTNNLTRGIQDPGAFIGKAKVKSHALGVAGSGVLDLVNPMGMAVYERMLLPAEDPLALNELSIGFAFDASATSTGEKGELVIPDVQLVEISVVHTGAQRTQVMNLKSGTMESVWDMESLDLIESIVSSMKAGRTISAANLAKLRAAQEVINELLAFGETEIVAEQKSDANGEEPQANPEEQGPDAELRRQLTAALS